MALLVGNVLRHAARYTPRRVAATYDGGGSVTFAELDERANRAGYALAASGVTHGDRVAWWGDTSLEALTIFGALAKLGAVFVPVNARLGADEAATVDRLRPPATVLADDDASRRSSTGRGFDVARPRRARPRTPRRHPTADVGRARARRARPARHLLHERQHRAAEGRRALAPRQLPAQLPGAGVATSPAGTVCMFPLFHMAGWSLALGVLADAAARSTSWRTPDADDAARRRASATARQRLY